MLQDKLRACAAQVRLQRPTVSAEMSFMLAVTSFFVPGFALGGITPAPFTTYDLLLTGDGLFHLSFMLSAQCIDLALNAAKLTGGFVQLCSLALTVGAAL